MTKNRKGKNRKKTTIRPVILITAIFIFCLLLAVTACFLFISGNKDGKIILAINSKACHCVKSKCLNMQKEVKEFLSEKGYSSIEMKTYDISSGEEAKKAMDKYQMPTVPYLVLVNGGEDIKYKANAFEFNKDALEGAIKIVLKEVKND